MMAGMLGGGVEALWRGSQLARGSWCAKSSRHSHTRVFVSPLSLCNNNRPRAITMSSFLYNLLVFSPLLLLAAGALYLLDNYGRPPPPQPVLQPDGEAEQEEVEDTATPASLELSDDDEGDEPFGDDDGGQSEAEAEEDEEPPVDPGNPQPLRATRSRVVGTKKARSLAARDRRRAYHEFLQSQAQQREKEEEAAREEDEARAFENARRRYLLEDEIAARKQAEREERLLREKAEREREAKDAAEVVRVMRDGRSVVLKDVAGRLGRSEEWVGRIVKREGFLGTAEDGAVGMVTKKGVWVRFDKEMAEKLLATLGERGRMEWGEIAEVMEGLLRGER